MKTTTSSQPTQKTLGDGFAGMKKDATFSPCRKYRYRLERRWGRRAPAVFIGLNPSTADETLDDPTIRRCIGFARTWNCGGLVMLNLFAWRSTYPRVLGTVHDPVGPGNNAELIRWSLAEGPMIAAWGVHGSLLVRDIEVCGMVQRIQRLQCLGLTKDGFPRHPLYVRGDAALVEFKGAK